MKLNNAFGCEGRIKPENNQSVNDPNYYVELRLESTCDLKLKDLSSIPTSATW